MYDDDDDSSKEEKERIELMTICRLKMECHVLVEIISIRGIVLRD